MPSAVKEKLVNELTEDLKKSLHIIVTEYQGLKAEEFDQLRAQLRAVGAKYKVIKNRLAQRALKNVGWELLNQSLKGPSAIAYQGTNSIALVKVLYDYSAKNKNLKVKAGHLFGFMADAPSLKVIANLPSREVLLSTLLARLNSPLQSLMMTLKEPIRSLHGALSAVAKKKESAPAA